MSDNEMSNDSGNMGNGGSGSGGLGGGGGGGGGDNVSVNIDQRFNKIWDDLISKKLLFGELMNSEWYHIGDIKGLKEAKNLT